MLLAILLAFSSCIKEEFNADLLNPSLQINPGVAAPIGWARWQLDEILGDSLNPDELIINSEGFISLVYKQDLFSLQASEIIDIPDIPAQTFSLQNSSGMTIDLNLIQGDTTIFDTLVISLPINGSTGAEIDSIRLRSGDITISASTQYDRMDWDARIAFLGDPNSQVTLDALNPTRTRSLAGRTLTLDNSPPNSNALSLVLILSIRTSNEYINPGPIIDFSISISDIEYSAIYGYLGQFGIDVGPRSFPLNFFSSLSGGTFHFRDPQLKIEFQNSFGIPIQITMNNFQATGSGGQITPITGDSVPDLANPRILAYPQWGQEGQSIPDNLILTSGNTNLFTILETSPSEITVEVNGTTNPAGFTNENFLLDSSRISVSTELLLPMDGNADLLLIADTLDFALGDFYESTPEEIISLIFRLNFINQFPVSVLTQLYFTDEGYNIQDSLFHDDQDQRKLVGGANVFNNEGYAEPLPTGPVEIKLSSEQIENISGSRHIIVKGRITTTGFESSPPANVRFFPDYFFKAFIGAIAELEINSDDY